MRLLRPRFVLWLLMVVIAATAIAMGGWVLRERAREYQKRADLYAKMEEQQVRDVARQERSVQNSIEAIKQLEDLYGVEGARSWRFTSETNEAVQYLQSSLWTFEDEKERLEENRKTLAESKATVAYFADLKRKYRYAASHPWPTPRPDPPPSVAVGVDYWLAKRDYRRVLDVLDELLKSHPYSTDYLNSKAWTLATCPEARCRNGKLAVEAATKACILTGWKDPQSVGTLAAAYAEAGDFEAAIRWQTEALDHPDLDSPDRQEFRNRLTLYRLGKPYREEPKADFPERLEQVYQRNTRLFLPPVPPVPPWFPELPVPPPPPKLK